MQYCTMGKSATGTFQRPSVPPSFCLLKPGTSNDHASRHCYRPGTVLLHRLLLHVILAFQEYEDVAPTLDASLEYFNSDRICRLLTVCNGSQYASRVPEKDQKGFFQTDRQCAELTFCNSFEYEVSLQSSAFSLDGCFFTNSLFFPFRPQLLRLPLTGHALL